MRSFLQWRANRIQIDAEIEDHLAEKAEALVAQGMSREEAGQRARRDFGNALLIKELSLEEWSLGAWEGIASDGRFAVRSLRRNGGFATTAILTLALGIGANAAIFNLLHAVIMGGLPVANAEQLRLFSVIRDGESDESILSYPVLSQMQSASGGQTALAGFSAISTMTTIEANGEQGSLSTQLVTGNFFVVLGVKAQTGELLSASDDNLTSTYPGVLSGAFWARQFARDPSILGKAIRVNDTLIRIVGVAPDRFFGVSPGSQPDIWLPVSAQHDLRYHSNVWNSNGDDSHSFLTQPQVRWLSVIARVPDPMSLGRLTALMNQIYAQDMQREVKGWSDPGEIRRLLRMRIRLDAGDRGLASLRDQFSTPLTILMCAAGFVLLIASVNLASLGLARVVSRRKEFAVRRSLGATSGRIIRQFIAEVLVLAIAGGALAIPIALTASHLLVRWASHREAMPLDVGLSPSIMWFVGGASMAAGVAFGLLPGFEAINFPLADAMKSQASSLKGMRLPWGRTLIAIQIAFSFVLLKAAILFVRTLINYTHLNLGFTPDYLLSVRVDPLGAHYKLEQLDPVYHEILGKLNAVPGVQAAAFSTSELAVGPSWISSIRTQDRPGVTQRIQELYVSPGYFSTVGMRLVSGRVFNTADTASKPILAVINQTAARKFFPDRSPLGRRFGYGDDNIEVIGVVADAHVNNAHDRIVPMTFYSLDQSPQYAVNIEIRAAGTASQIEQSIRAVLQQAAPRLPMMRISRVTDLLANNLLRERLVARLASVFSVLALLLSCIGIYGVLAYAITRRTGEIGIRLALGAAAGEVRWMVLREALAVILIGLGVGVPVAIAVTRFIKGLLYGLSATDPLSLLVGAFAILSVGFAAAYVPALRASRVDPNVALRYE